MYLLSVSKQIFLTLLIIWFWTLAFSTEPVGEDASAIRVEPSEPTKTEDILIWLANKTKEEDAEKINVREREELPEDLLPSKMPEVEVDESQGLISPSQLITDQISANQISADLYNSSKQQDVNNETKIDNSTDIKKGDKMDWRGEHTCNDDKVTVRHDKEFKGRVDQVESEYKQETGVSIHLGESFAHVYESIMKLKTANACVETFDHYKCATTTTYNGVIVSRVSMLKCCMGYKRYANTTQCRKDESLTVAEIVKKIEAMEFVKALESENVLLENISNYTLFLPPGGEFTRFLRPGSPIVPVKQTLKDKSGKPVRERDTFYYNELTLNHMLPAYLEITTLKNDTVLKPMFVGSSLRYNIFPKSTREKFMMTINCVRVDTPDLKVEDGVVHVMESMIPPTTMNIKDTLIQSPHFKSFRKLFQHPKIAPLFERDVDEPFTLLLPQEQAYVRLPDAVKRMLKSGNDCSLSVIKTHIINGIFCTTTIGKEELIHNILGNSLNFSKNYAGRIMINSKQKIVRRDIMTVNGVIHVINGFLYPPEGRTLSQTLEEHRFVKFLEVLRRYAGLEKHFNSLSNKTLFAPTDKALADEVYLSMRRNMDDVSYVTLLDFFIIPGMIPESDFLNNLVLKTELLEHGRVNVYVNVEKNRLPTGHEKIRTYCCGLISKIDLRSCGMVIHGIDKLMLPPTQTIFEIIDSENRYAMFRDILRDTKSEDLLRNTTSITLLVPTKAAWTRLGEKELKVILRDKEKANNIVKSHVLRDVICCTGITYDSVHPFYVYTWAGYPQKYGRGDSGEVCFGNVKVTKCDILATNGLIHEIDRVLLPTKHQETITDLHLYYDV